MSYACRVSDIYNESLLYLLIAAIAYVNIAVYLTQSTIFVLQCNAIDMILK